jgi:hypothetical protein
MTTFRHRRIRGACVAVALSIITVAPALGQQPRVTLERIMSAPFATELVAAPAAGRVAWVQNVLGARSILIADPPDYRSRQLLVYPGDDGRRVAQLDFTPDGTAIVYTRGGAQSGARMAHLPNPTLDPAGSREEIWLVSVDGGVPARVDDGYGASVSPRGDLVIYTKSDELWSAPLVRRGNDTMAG